MILYNTTFNVELAIENDWLKWVRTSFVADIVASGFVVEHKILKLLTEIENGGATYSVQCWFENMENCIGFQNDCLEAAQQKMYEKYSGKFVLFSTLLEEV